MDPLFDFTDQVVLVTGGSRGLGLEMVRAFAARGADVIIASRKLENCEEAAAEVRALGRRALAVAAHVGKWDECDRLVEAAYGTFGRIDVLINNAGMGPACPSHEVTEQLFDSVVNLNFKGPFRLAAQVAHRMNQGEGGCIINVSSSGGLRPLAGIVPYGASKAALNMLLRTIAIEWARSHPRAVVAALHPGTVATALSAPFQRGVAPDKLFTPAMSAAALLRVIDGLTPADSGGFFAWDGAMIPF